MKRILTVLLVVLMIPALSLAAPLELDGATKEELLAWRQQIDDKLVEMGWYAFAEITSKTTGEQVVRLQDRLAELNYFDGEVSGKYDKGTTSAFAAFMKAHDQKAGKSVSIENQRLLFSDDVTPNPTPTPPPPPTPAPTPIPDEAMLQVSKANLFLTRNTKCFNVDIKNFSSDYTIDAFSVAYRVYDVYGELLTTGEEYADWWRELALKPGSEFSMKRYYWSMYRHDTAAKIEVAISKFHTTDDKTFDIPPEKYVWVEGVFVK